MERIRRGVVVEHNGKRGVTVDDFMSCCAVWETPVVYEGDTSFKGTMTTELKVIGLEDPGIGDGAAPEPSAREAAV